MMRQLFYGLCISFLFLFCPQLHAQLLPPNQPEQDACNALLLCGNSFFTPYSYQGVGMVGDMPSTPCGSGEANSVWLKIVVSGAGSIVFTITPVDTVDDYDFAIIDATHKGCDSINSNDVVRCNFNNNLQPNPYYFGGIVGLADTGTLSSVASGTYGKPFLKRIDAQVGDVYLIMINNFGHGGAPSSGFTIDFSGSTATFLGNGNPEYDSIAPFSCGTLRSLTIHMKEPILCSSIAADGSDFQILPSVANVISAAGVNCGGSNGYTQTVTINFNAAVPEGNYILRPQTGTDGNTLIDLCNEEQLLSDQISFQVVNPIVNAGPDTTTCVNNMIQLQATLADDSNNIAYKIVWSPATYLNDADILNPFASPMQDITYKITAIPVDRPECAVSDSVHITVLQGFDILNPDTLICIGQSVAMRVEGDSRYNYSWSPTDGLSNPNLGAPIATPGATTTYTLTASYPGCRDSMQSITINIDSGLTTPFYFTPDRDSICSGETIYFKPHIEQPITLLKWDFGDGSKITAYDEKTVQHAYDRAGAHEVQLIASLPACPDTASLDTVYVYALPKVSIGSDSGLCLHGAPIILKNFNKLPAATYRNLWSTGDTTGTLKVVHPGVYRLTVTNGPVNCSTTEMVKITKDCYIDIPNAFTPNGDGENDYFLPRQLLSKNLTKFHMQVFNRWGVLVFETTKTDGRGWDGKFNGVAQPEGVYVYLIDAETNDAYQEHYQGNVTLLR